MTIRKTDLRNPIYHDEDAARAHLESLLWPQGPVCPRCGVMEDRITKLQGASTRSGVYKCKDCRKPFSVTVGTVMERSHVPLSKWVMAAHFMAASKKGMSALQLMRMLGTNYETAWFLFHRLREAARDTTNFGPLGGEGKVVEADETFVGGKEKNKRLSKRNKANIGAVGKSIAFTLVERGGHARSFHVANVNGKTLAPIIFKHVDQKTTLNTDGAGQYRNIGPAFARFEVVDHVQNEYVRGDAYTNTVEGYFSILKRGVIGTFHSISEAHLHRYLSEFDFRYNTRKISDVERAELLVKGAKGKRLLYRQPDSAPHV
jgi:transposase-like protein